MRVKLNRYDFYSGEPVSGSPNFMSTDVITTDMSNITMNNMGQQTQYSYDPNTRYMQMNQGNQFFQPGSYGYNTYQSPYQNMQFGGNQQPFMNPPIYGNNNGFSGYQGNPALSMFGNNGFGFNGFNPYYQQPVYQDKIVHVPGFNTGTDVLFPENIEEICDKMQIEMMIEQEEAIAERNKRFQGYFNNNFGVNYYGMPFTSNYMDQSIMSKYRTKIEQLKQEAVERRIALNKRLSRLVHNYLDDGMTDEDIDRVYEGYSYTIPGNELRMQAEMDRFSKMQPVSNQPVYMKHFANVSNMYNTFIGSNANMQEFLNAQGILEIYNNMEEELHKRRDGSRYYQEDGYKRFLRKAINEKKGITTPDYQMDNGIPMGTAFPTLSQSAKMMEDGTISITAPSWLGGRQIQLNNEMEQHFEENRNRFLQSIYAQGD